MQKHDLKRTTVSSHFTLVFVASVRCYIVKEMSHYVMEKMNELVYFDLLVWRPYLKATGRIIKSEEAWTDIQLIKNFVY